MTRPKYVASCSGGKDSVATLLLAAQHNEPLDEAVFSEVMFDKDTSGEVPEHRDFIYDWLKPVFLTELVGVRLGHAVFGKQTDLRYSIMSSPADRTRARFAALHGLVCVQSIVTAKSRQSASTMPHSRRTL